MRAGYGKSELTPPPGVELAGYGYYLGRRAASVRDPLYARALWLEEGGFRCLVISCDLLGLSREVCAGVFAHAEALGIPRERVLILSIHTHTGPAVKYHEGCGYTDEEYVRTVAPAICRAVDAAEEDLDTVTALEEASGQFGEGYVYNRTIPDGPADRTVRTLHITRRHRPALTAVSAACHGVFRGRVPAVSADFAGEICRLLEKRGVLPIYLNGLCGDIDPCAQRDDLLEAFARAVTARTDQDRKALPLTLWGGSFPFSLRLLPVTEEQIRRAAEKAAENAGGPEAPAARVALIWEREMLARFDSLPDTEDITVKYLVAGGVPILALPFEGFTRIGMDIRRLCGREDALVLGCAEELLGYLPTRDAIARGTYAALESTFLYKRLPVVPGEAERLGETLGQRLKEALAKGGA